MKIVLIAAVIAAVISVYMFTRHPSAEAPSDARTNAPENPPVVVAVLQSLRDPSATAHLNALLAAGADPNAVDAAGRPVLSLAVRDNDAGAAEALIAKGADVNKRDQNQWTPLMTAAFEAARDPRFLGMIKLLLAHGADPNAAKDGTTALHVAVNNLPDTAKEAPVIEALLAGGAKPDGVPATGAGALSMPPIHLAAWNGKTAAALALAKGGATLSPTQKGGKSAAQTARDHGHAELASQLESLGQKK